MSFVIKQFKCFLFFQQCQADMGYKLGALTISMKFSVDFFGTNETILFHTKDMVGIEPYHLVRIFEIDVTEAWTTKGNTSKGIPPEGTVRFEFIPE